MIIPVNSTPKGRKEPGEGISHWLERFKSDWVKSATCPDPQFYRVDNSAWIKETDANKWGCNHYLLISERSSVELLARSFEWKSIKDLD